MYHQGKYVAGIVKSDLDLELAICFPESANHASMAIAFTEVVSAGFFTVSDNLEVIVYGKSVSLKLESRKEDERLIAQALGLYDRGACQFRSPGE